MRTIDTRLLWKDLQATSLPINGVQICANLDRRQRATYVKYFTAYIKITWAENPTGNYQKKLLEILSVHADVDIESDQIIEQEGGVTGYGTPIKTVSLKEYRYIFKNKLSQNLIPHLKLILNSNVSIQRTIRRPSGAIHESLIGVNAKARRNLENAIKAEAVFKNLPNEKILYFYNGVGVINETTFANWLINASLKTKSAQNGLKAVNEFILEPNRIQETICCINGFKVEQMKNLIPETLELITIDDLKSYPNYNIPENEYSSFTKVKPTAGLIYKYKLPKFAFSNKKQNAIDKRDNYQELINIISLLTLFGPSAPKLIFGFQQSKPHPALLKNDVSSYFLNPSEAYPNQTPYIPDVQEFSKIYYSFNGLDKKIKKQVEISLIHLNNSLRATDITEKALYLGIALEVILLPDGLSGEITYRLAIRGARLLGNSPVSRQQTFKTLKAAYALRSSAAHKGKVEPKTKKIHTTYLIQDASKLCAEAIHKTILMGGMPDWEKIVLE